MSSRDSVSIRFFVPEDTDSLVEVLHDMSQHYNGDNASTREVVRRNLIDNILGPDSDVRVVVAASGTRVVGVAMVAILYPASKERAQLFMKELYVVSDCRSGGIGRQLMHWIARYALAKNCARFDWTVDADSPRAVALYRSLGATHLTDRLYFRFSGEDLTQFANGARSSS